MDLRARPTPDRDVIWWNNSGEKMNALDILSYTEAEIRCRERIMKATQFVKEAKVPGFEGSYLQETASQLGVRHARQLKGEYFVTEEDFRRGTTFEDTILHGALGSGCDRKAGWNIPYRSLIPGRK